MPVSKLQGSYRQVKGSTELQQHTKTRDVRKPTDTSVLLPYLPTQKHPKSRLTPSCIQSPVRIWNILGFANFETHLPSLPPWKALTSWMPLDYQVMLQISRLPPLTRHVSGTKVTAQGVCGSLDGPGKKWKNGRHMVLRLEMTRWLDHLSDVTSVVQVNSSLCL